MQSGVAILGAGIAGLAAAVACQRHNVNYQLFDQSGHPLDGGAALTLWPNALIALKRLRVFETIPYWVHFNDTGSVRTHQDAVLYQLPLGWMKHRYGFSPTCIRRSDLSKWLYSTLGYPLIRRARIMRVTSEDEISTVHFSDGSSERFQGVIAADGIHSAERRNSIGDTARTSHYTAWRGVADSAPAAAESMCEYWGPGTRFGYAAIDASSTYWFATVNNHLLPRDCGHWWPAAKERLREFPSVEREFIDQTPAETILQTPVQDLPPGAPMAVHNIAFIGDAAHALTPNLGLGACLALEDAAVLAESLESGGSLKDVFHAYASRRQGRVASITRFARWLGNTTQWENHQLIAARNQIMQAVPTSMTKVAWKFILS